MDLRHRNHVSVNGHGPSTLVFSHGFGCNQAMWNYLAPHFLERFRVVLYDLVGAGLSDLNAFDKAKYSGLDGYARDLNEIIDAYAEGPVILVGHSVSAMIGTLADRFAPGRIAAHVMIGPSPRYIDTDDYIGSFKRGDIDDLLDTLDSNYLGWSSAMAPVIMGAPTQPALSTELTESFCRTETAQCAQVGRSTAPGKNRHRTGPATGPGRIERSLCHRPAPGVVRRTDGGDCQPRLEKPAHRDPHGLGLSPARRAHGQGAPLAGGISASRPTAPIA